MGRYRRTKPLWPSRCNNFNHVLEHISDLSSFFSKIKKLINKDTLVYIAVPSLASIGFAYRNNACRYFQIAHVWHFTNNTLDFLMKKEGFEKIESNELIQGVYKYTKNVIEKIYLSDEYYKSIGMLHAFDKRLSESIICLENKQILLKNEQILLQKVKNRKKFYKKLTAILTASVIFLVVLLILLQYF